MTIRKITSGSGGFSLIEILIAMTVMGVLLTAVMSVYIDTQKSTTTQKDVVDVQQNLRTAMESIAADIRTAGFLTGGEPLRDFTDETLTIRSASVRGRFARIDQDSSPTGSEASFRVVSGKMTDLFSTGSLVRIIRPTTNDVIEDGSSASLPLTVSATPDRTARTIPLKNLTGGVAFKEGDLIVLTKAGLTPVTRIIYSRDEDNDTLIRSVADDDGTVRYSQILASKITELLFGYDPNDEGIPRTVTVTLTGTTDLNEKTRQLRSSFSLRNL